MIRRPPRATRTDTLFPDTTLFRSNPVRPVARRHRQPERPFSLPKAPSPPICAPSDGRFAVRGADEPSLPCRAPGVTGRTRRALFALPVSLLSSAPPISPLTSDTGIASVRVQLRLIPYYTLDAHHSQ